MEKIKVGIIGTGNIGIDLLYKVQRSKLLECSIFIGRTPESKGLRIAEDMGIETTFKSIDYVKRHPDCCEIMFDATTAKSHVVHSKILKEFGIFAIDLTPARIGKMCVPAINLNECLCCDNVNLITCGGQATVPLAYAINLVHKDTKYLEIVASISSKSAGPGTRSNIDEFTQTTRDALKEFTVAESTKAIIILNSAEPPVNMRNTLYAIIDNPNMVAIKKSIHDMVSKIQEYVPGYRLLYEPTYESGRVSVAVEIVGLGDYLPKYSGNLDIITCAAIEIAESKAKSLLANDGSFS